MSRDYQPHGPVYFPPRLVTLAPSLFGLPLSSLTPHTCAVTNIPISSSCESSASGRFAFARWAYSALSSLSWSTLGRGVSLTQSPASVCGSCLTNRWNTIRLFFMISPFYYHIPGTCYSTVRPLPGTAAAAAAAVPIGRTAHYFFCTWYKLQLFESPKTHDQYETQKSWILNMQHVKLSHEEDGYARTMHERKS